MHVEPNGIYTEYLEDLETAGFVHRDYVHSLTTGERIKLSRYRLKDNYLRFYLRYIEPLRDRIEAGTLSAEDIPRIAAFDSIMGLQLENLVLRNLPLALKTLKIRKLHSASPYFQYETLRQKPCQVDLLIDTQYAVYLCEIKMRARISGSIVDDVNHKAECLKVSRGKSLRRVLIYMGELSPSIEESGAFEHIIPFERFLTPSSGNAPS